MWEFFQDHFFQPDYFQFYIMGGMALVLGLALYWDLKRRLIEAYELIYQLDKKVGAMIHQVMLLQSELILVEKEIEKSK